MGKTKNIIIKTNGLGLYDFTSELKNWVSGEGILHLFAKHTSASLLIQENFDPEVKTDLINFFVRLVPFASDPRMRYLSHRYEGEDDSLKLYINFEDYGSKWLVLTYAHLEFL